MRTDYKFENMNAIEVDKVSKKYYKYDSSEKNLRHLFKQRKVMENFEDGAFWALENVSFNIEVGTTVGLVGRNGSGKSTLLKIISRITNPTKGQLRIWGRVASLLEVGTGFHPDLSGKENIFFNGSLLGMTKLEIQSKYDQILEFSEIGDFIHMPVKKYSSGMYTRLAFAVGAFLESEILIIDEVLEVGDSTFQQKCLSHIKHLKDQGRTIILVSHNQTLIDTVCDSIVYLHKGKLLYAGPTRDYLNII